MAVPAIAEHPSPETHTVLNDDSRDEAAALITGAMSVEAPLGSIAPFSSVVQELRPHPGQVRVASILRQLLPSGDYREASAGNRIQDPYSVRCMPQVLGPCLDPVQQARTTLEIEANMAYVSGCSVAAR
ncbi:aromatic amino acid lyase [Nonomuraea sp. NPDC004186]